MNPATPLPANQLTFTIEEAAALLGISPSTAYESVHRGELPALRFGRRLVVTRHTLETMLGLNQTPPTDPTEAAGHDGHDGSASPTAGPNTANRTWPHYTDEHQRAEDPQAGRC